MQEQLAAGALPDLSKEQVQAIDKAGMEGGIRRHNPYVVSLLCRVVPHICSVAGFEMDSEMESPEGQNGLGFSAHAVKV